MIHKNYSKSKLMLSKVIQNKNTISVMQDHLFYAKKCIWLNDTTYVLTEEGDVFSVIHSKCSKMFTNVIDIMQFDGSIWLLFTCSYARLITDGSIISTELATYDISRFMHDLIIGTTRNIVTIYNILSSCVECEYKAYSVFDYYYDPCVQKSVFFTCGYKKGLLRVHNGKCSKIHKLIGHRYKILKNVYILSLRHAIVQLISSSYASMSWTFVINLETLNVVSEMHTSTIIHIDHLFKASSTLIICTDMFFILDKQGVHHLTQGYTIDSLVYNIDVSYYPKCMYYAYHQCMPCLSRDESFVVYVSYNMVCLASTSHPYDIECFEPFPQASVQAIYPSYDCLLVNTYTGTLFSIRF